MASMDMGLGGLWELVMDREAWRRVVHGLQRVGHDLGTGQQHHIYLGIIFIPPASSKGIKGYKVV